jgi:hypothetical protein
MSDLDEEANAQRAQSILTQALQEAEIKERHNLDPFPPLLGGSKIYWQQVDNDIELIFNAVRWGGEKLRASIFLKGLAVQTATLFPNDVDAVKALVDSLKYMQATILELLPRISHELLARSFNLLNKQGLSAKERRILKKAHENIIEPMKLAFEERRKELGKQLRAEHAQQWRGGSEPEIQVSDEQCVMLANDYPALLQHWNNVKKWRKKKTNWRIHAKVDQPDTPNDLLDKLCSLDSYERQPSALAHEHAARRCGIPDNVYSLSTLSRLRRRGNKIHGQSKVAND